MNYYPRDIQNIIHSYAEIEDLVIREYPVHSILNAYDVSPASLFILCARYGKVGMMEDLLPMVDLLEVIPHEPLFYDEFEDGISLYGEALLIAATEQEEDSVIFLLSLNVRLPYEEFSEIFFMVDDIYADMIAKRFVRQLSRNQITKMAVKAASLDMSDQMFYWIEMGADVPMRFKRK